MADTQFADRVREMRRLKPSELKQHPDNWRQHGTEQRHALRYVLSKVGVAGVTVAYEDPEWGLTLIDGHMRQDELAQEVPVVILDVTRDEARLLLLSMDAIAGMAERDDAKVSQLIRDTYSPTGDYLTTMQNLFRSVSQRQEAVIDEAEKVLGEKTGLAAETRMPLAAELNEQYDYVVLLCRTVNEFHELCDHLGVDKVQDYKSSAVGMGRVVMYESVKSKLGMT